MDIAFPPPAGVLNTPRRGAEYDLEKRFGASVWAIGLGFGIRTPAPSTYNQMCAGGWLKLRQKLVIVLSGAGAVQLRLAKR